MGKVFVGHDWAEDVAVNPMSTSRYRERHSTSGAKSDPGDAKILADLARTDAHNHRPIAGDSELGEAIKVLARAHQSMIWTRQRQTNQLRSTLREFYPGALEAFDELAGRDALAILAIASTPTAGRQRRIEQRAAEIQTALRTEHLAAPDLIADAMGVTVSALVAVIGELNTQIGGLEAKLADRFEQHPDAKIIRSLPGLGMTLGARVLGEFGDAPNRYSDAKSRKNYSGMSPITRASGKHHVVLARRSQMVPDLTAALQRALQLERDRRRRRGVEVQRRKGVVDVATQVEAAARERGDDQRDQHPGKRRPPRRVAARARCRECGALRRRH